LGGARRVPQTPRLPIPKQIVDLLSQDNDFLPQLRYRRFQLRDSLLVTRVPSSILAAVAPPESILSRNRRLYIS
jgi:hypothetical protein